MKIPADFDAQSFKSRYQRSGELMEVLCGRLTSSLRLHEDLGGLTLAGMVLAALLFGVRFHVFRLPRTRDMRGTYRFGQQVNQRLRKQRAVIEQAGAIQFPDSGQLRILKLEVAAELSMAGRGIHHDESGQELLGDTAFCGRQVWAIGSHSLVKTLRCTSIAQFRAVLKAMEKFPPPSHATPGDFGLFSDAPLGLGTVDRANGLDGLSPSYSNSIFQRLR